MFDATEPIQDSEPKGTLRRGPRRPISTRRRWLFRFIAATVIPALLVITLEGALRLVGYGYPTSFFIESRQGDRAVSNHKYGWRFFPRRIARAPVPLSLATPKPPGTYRIFTLGASASLGFPDPAYGYGRILEVMLQSTFSEIDFEVGNVSMTAINSHVARLIARDCADYEPDLFIVYLGHNEVVGPYGPASVFKSFSPGVGTIRASLWTRSTRLGQVIENLTAGISGGGDETQS